MMLYLYTMEFARLTVVLAVVLAAHYIEAEVCSKDNEVFRGIARDRCVNSNSKTVRLDVSNLSSFWLFTQRKDPRNCGPINAFF